MPYLSAADIHYFYCSVVQAVAASPKVGVTHSALKSTAELAHEIRLISPSVFDLLDKFIKAYQSWYDVTIEIENAGTAGNLTPKQSQELQDAILARDFARTALLAAV